MSEFHLFQQHVATRLGVSEERVRELRAGLVEGRDWQKRGARILYADGAVDRLARVLCVPKSPPPAPVRLLGFPARHWIVVAKLWANPGYVGGMLWPGAEEFKDPPQGFHPVPEGPGPMVRVRVRSTALLRRGMVLSCVHVGSDLYEATRLPRRMRAAASNGKGRA